MDTNDKKALFLISFKCLDGNVTRACEAAQISRQTYYNWKEEDEEFAAVIKELEVEVTEGMLDRAEEVMRHWLDRMDRETAKWVLAKKGAGRGYGAKVTVEHTGDAFKGNTYPDEPDTVEAWEGTTPED